ncbi:MAG: hypothetical protein MMC23_008661 [Stictis urceolatum]|nr:hypothetical protein [Stictis urceolata]
MDDLAGLSWTPSSSQQQKQQQSKPSTAQGNYFTSIRATPPISARSTPALAPQSSSQIRSNLGTSNPPSKSTTPAPDSFANLLPQFNAAANTKNLSLQEQQRRLQEQKSKQTNPRSKQWDGDVSALEAFGSGRSGTPANGTQSPAAFGGASASLKTEETEEDILAAFGKDALVDKSSHFPAPGGSRSGSTVPAQMASRQHTPAPISNSMNFPEDEDDPFGLGSGTNGPSNGLTYQAPMPDKEEDDDDDDVLGLLGKPVSELPPPKASTPEAVAVSKEVEHPQDKAVAELVDMGFPAEKAREALEATGSGLDVQAAVGWILSQAHAESKSILQAPTNGERQAPSRAAQSRPRPGRTESTEDDSGIPTWMRSQSRSSSAPRRDASKSPANGEKDPAKVASEIGNNLFKTANSLWKTGAKKINKAVAEFNADNDPSQPKWMRDAMAQEQAAASRPRQPPATGSGRQQSSLGKQAASDLLDVTDEAKMLEAGVGRPQPKQKQQLARTKPQAAPSRPSPRTQSPLSRPQFGQEPVSRSRMRQTLEEESAQAYVSPARRKKATPKPPSPEPDLDLLLNESQRPTQHIKPASLPTRPVPRTQPQTQSPPKPTPAPARPKAPPRTIPPLSSIALQSSTQHRQAGNAAFKLGNYSAAGSSYTFSLSTLPPTHPLQILLLTNRALTSLKIGDPKSSIADADSALTLIGPCRGEHETIDTGTDEGKKDMAPFWGKAMMRRAEALEQLERWADAGKVWKECVQAGVGGAQAIQARGRCERAANPAPKRPVMNKARTAPAKPRPAAARVSALSELEGRPASTAPSTGANSEAVERMRKANAEAERADDERFRLADSVDARLAGWRKGKEGNLRALLGSLDTVLWEGSGWKKVGMGELILPGKVKVVYMKGIGRVHPDKLSQSATTEQVMISQAVFSTLNEAWDKFKTENGL